MIIIVTYLFINARFFNYFSLIVQFFVNPILQERQSLSNAAKKAIISDSMSSENRLNILILSLNFHKLFPFFLGFHHRLGTKIQSLHRKD